MTLARLKEFLGCHTIKYVSISHSLAYTSQGIAALTHISGNELAKTVMVKIDGALAMAVLPASSQVDLSLLRTAAGATHAVLASEQEFKDTFPDCEIGALPPFGNLYDLPVFAEESLCRDKEIAFIGNLYDWLGKICDCDLIPRHQPRAIPRLAGGTA